jgi:quercetin dioxygenase-like cupin family protein
MKCRDLLISLHFAETELANRLITSQESLSEFTAIGDSLVAIVVFGPGEKRGIHTHPEIRLTFVRSGRMRSTVEEATTEVGAGDLIYILPDVPHSFEVISDEPLRIVELVIPLPGQELVH